jgi:asparagine synthase (glutamine-hydrolysing)
MCGIGGVFWRDPARPVERELLVAMGQAIAHRGPDAEGFLLEPGVGFVHRRLSIIDLKGGDQPIGNEDGSIQVVFNGEIYNFQELSKELEAKGHVLRTRSDTEVLVHLYEEMGPALVDRLRGMFAFAIWDRRQRRLMLARDRLGIKPLYLLRDGTRLLFGSELKAILAVDGIPRQIDEEALEDYLTFGMVPGERSIFRGIHKLPPAHVLVIDAEHWNNAAHCYWKLRLEPDPRPTADQWQEQIRAKVDEAVRLHLIADVPVGAFLSGGVDSSVVVASTAGKTNGPLQTFSIGFADQSLSELPFARQTAAQFGTQHVEEIVTPQAVDLLGELTHFYDEPFADSSAIPTYLVARLASRSVKVVLSGDGGDEGFGGYARYAHDLQEAAIRDRLPLWFRNTALRAAGRVWPKADWLPRPMRLKTFLTNLALGPDAAYANTLSLCRPPLRRQLLSGDVVRSLNGHRPELAVQTGYGRAPAGDALAGMIAADTAMLLPDDFLVKVDRATMAHGLEARPPLLDHELLELAGRIPSEYKVRDKKTKWIFKEAFRAQLPLGLLERKKQGFEIPVDAWLRGPLREMFQETVLAPGAPVGDLINQSLASRLYGNHASGVRRVGGVLWSLLVLALWSDRYLHSFRINPSHA